MTRPSLQSAAISPYAGDCVPSGVACSFPPREGESGGISASNHGGFLSISSESHDGFAGNRDHQLVSYCAICACAPFDTYQRSNTPVPSPSDRERTDCHRPNNDDVLPRDTPRPQVVSRMTLSMSMQRWVNSESTQTGGSVLESTGGSILESVKAQLPHTPPLVPYQ